MQINSVVTLVKQMILYRSIALLL